MTNKEETKEQISTLLENAIHEEDRDEKLKHLSALEELLLHRFDGELIPEFLKSVLEMHVQASSYVRRFLAAFIEKVCMKNTKYIKTCAEHLLFLSLDSNATVIKRVISTLNHVYRPGLQLVCQTTTQMDDAILQMWGSLDQLKKKALEQLDPETPNVTDGIKTHAIKFVETLVLAYSDAEPEGFDPNGPGMIDGVPMVATRSSSYRPAFRYLNPGDDFHVGKVPPVHTLISALALREEAKTRLDTLLQVAKDLSAPSTHVSVAVQCLVNIVKQRPQFWSEIIPVLCRLPARLNSTQMSKQSMLHTVKGSLLLLLKMPALHEYRQDIFDALVNMDARDPANQSIKYAERVTADIEQEKKKSSLKRSREEDQEESQPAAKRPRIDEPQSPRPRTPPGPPPPLHVQFPHGVPPPLQPQQEQVKHQQPIPQQQQQQQQPIPSQPPQPSQPQPPVAPPAASSAATPTSTAAPPSQPPDLSRMILDTPIGQVPNSSLSHILVDSMLRVQLPPPRTPLPSELTHKSLANIVLRTMLSCPDIRRTPVEQLMNELRKIISGSIAMPPRNLILGTAPDQPPQHTPSPPAAVQQQQQQQQQPTAAPPQPHTAPPPPTHAAPVAAQQPTPPLPLEQQQQQQQLQQQVTPPVATPPQSKSPIPPMTTKAQMSSLSPTTMATTTTATTTTTTTSPPPPSLAPSRTPTPPLSSTTEESAVGGKPSTETTSVLPPVKRINKVFKTRAQSLSEETKQAMVRRGFQSIVDAKEDVMREGQEMLRLRLLTKMASYGKEDDHMQSVLLDHIRQDPKGQLELALQWLFQELGMEMTSGKHEEGSGRYERLFDAILDIYLKHGLFDSNLSSIVVDSPRLPRESLDKLVGMIREKTLKQPGIDAIRDLVLHRPSIRQHALQCLLDFAIDPDVGLRKMAIPAVTSLVFKKPQALTEPVEKFAFDKFQEILSPQKVVKTKPKTQEDSDKTTKTEGDEGEGRKETPDETKESNQDDEDMKDTEKSESKQEESDQKPNQEERHETEEEQEQKHKMQSEDDRDKNENEHQESKEDKSEENVETVTETQYWSSEEVKRRIGLLFSLCVSRHELLSKFVEYYEQITPKNPVLEPRKTIHMEIHGLIRTLGQHSPVVLNFLSSCRPKSRALAFLAIQIIVDSEQKLSTQFLQVVKKTFFDNVRDAHFLIPIMTSLTRSEAIEALPAIVKLPDAKRKKAFDRLLAQAHMEAGVATAPKEVLSPIDLLIELHKINFQDDRALLAKIIDSMDYLMNNQDIYTQKTLAIVLQRLLTITPTPQLALRTVINAYKMHKQLANTVLEILSKLIHKQVWKDSILWPGWYACAKTIEAYGVMLQLPKTAFEKLLHDSPDLKPTLQRFVKENPNVQVNRSLLSVLESSNQETTGEEKEKEGEKNQNESDESKS